MAETLTCQECLILKRNSENAYRSWSTYRPMHHDARPKSRWFKDDKRAVEALERAYNLAEAKYNLHRAEHDKSATSDPQGFVRNFNIVMRNGRLRP